MNSTPLSRLLATLVASVAPLSVACAVQPTVMPEIAACPAAGLQGYKAFTLAPSVDGAVFVSIHSATTGAPRNPVTVGATCARAKDQAACQAQVDGLLATAKADADATDTTTTPRGWQYTAYYPGGRGDVDRGIVTEGDTVREIDTFDGLRSVVAPLQSLDAAAAFYKFSGRNITCGVANARTEADGYVLQQISTNGCGGEYETLTKVYRDGRLVTVSSQTLHEPSSGCAEGRRPAGFLQEDSPDWLLSLDAHLREIAYMEAAAVAAFDELHGELARVGAPTDLLRRIRQARKDEVHHARIMENILATRGILPKTLNVAAPLAQSLPQLAMHNATEGCVRETYGALVAAHQAAYATSPDLRAAFAQIARDEAEHAQLSLDLADWFDRQLTRAERAQVTRAKIAAYAQLLSECAALNPSDDVARDAGMPRAHAAYLMVAGLQRGLGAMAA